MPSNFPGGEGGILDYFLVVNKAGDDPQRQDGSMRLMNPRTHNPQNVDADDMSFSGSVYNPTQMGQQSSPGRLDPGTMVYGIKVPGQSQVIVLGQAQTQKKSGSGAGGGGGNDLLSGFSDVFSDKLPINVPPTVQETTDADGVKVRKIKEKGEQHSFNLLDGLPSHGASFPMAGYRQPELPNVPTARQQNTGMMNMQMMEQMMGQIMSMGQMFQGLMGNRGGGGGGGGMSGGGAAGGGGAAPEYIVGGWPDDSPMNKILAALTPEMKTAVSNLSLLMQGLEANDGVAFFTGNVVHEDTYLKNAEELLSQVQSIDDLMYVLQRLQWDTTLFGHDKLQSVVTEIETAWGVALQEVTYDGEIIITYKDPAQADFRFTRTEIFLSGNGTIANVTSNTVGPKLWDAELYNLDTTVGLYKGTEIINKVDITGSLGSSGGIYTVVEITGDKSIRFKANGGTEPHAGNIADIYLISTTANTYGGGAETQFYQDMASSDSSPSIGSGGGGGGDSGGGKGGGGMGNMFGKASGMMQDMFKRLAPGGEKEATKMHQKLNQGKFPQNAANVAKKTKQGQSPLELFKSMGGMI